MRGKNGIYWINVCLTFILVVGSVVPIADFDGNDLRSSVIVSEPERRNVCVAGTPHAPIVIDGDDNFTLTASNEGWEGDGSSQNPFIIQGLDIDQGGTSGHCINISNTRSNFTIQNCNLTGASVSPGSGIYLNNVTFGEIVGNIFDNSYTSISLQHGSSYNTIADNNCSYNTDRGINLESGSHNNTVTSNTCSNNSYGIYLRLSDDNTVTNNTCSNNSYGVYIESSDDNTVTNNTCSNNDDGIFIAGGFLINTLSNNTCNSNTRAGIYLNWTLSHIVVNNTCSNNSYGIHLESSNSITVSDNTCYYNNYGICLDGFGTNTVVNNTCNYNYYGIFLYGSLGHNTIAKNICNNNVIGIFLDTTDLNILVNNTCNNNQYCGIYLEYAVSNTLTNNTCSYNELGIYLGFSDTNDILWNVFDANSVHNGYDFEPSGNVFDYNYWSDYVGADANGDGFGDTPYMFAVNFDSHPLMFLPTPPIWTETLVDQTAMTSTHFTYDLNATAPAPIFWSVNDTVHFTIDNQGVLELIGILSLGDYGVQITVTNIYGSSISAKFNVEVVPFTESTAPGWVITPMNLTIEYGEVVDLQIPALDPSGIDHWNLNDTNHFALSATYYDLGSTARITNNSVLEPATYGLNITVYDSYDNSLSAIFTVTVAPPDQDTYPPTWVILRIYQTIDYGEALHVQVEAWDQAGIDHYWLNDTIHFTLDEFGMIRNASVLNSGIYRLEVRAYDPYDNYCAAILVVTVQDVPTTATPEGLDPLVTLAFGAGLGGVAVLVLVVVVLRRK